ncbi:MAG: hypothetical protein IT468_01605 [Rhodocyclaceae bacterium]|nr:hypothetical protein [Rhodocyclaceae bacterium]
MTDAPAHQQPIIAVDLDWVLLGGSRAQRRRAQRELRRQTAKSQSRRDGGK